MYRIDTPTAAAVRPTPSALGTEGYWTKGNPAGGVPATQMDQDWFQALQENLVAIADAAGIAHSKTDYTVLLRSIQKLGRIKLTANTTFYVATTGNDSTGTGLVVGSPWLTVQHAINVLLANYDLAGFTATISVADGTYTSPVAISAPFTGAGSVNIVGNTGTPSNVLFSTTSASAVTVSNGAVIGLSGVKLQTTTSGSGVFALNGGKILCNGPLVFGACSAAHIFADVLSTITISANYTINGAAPIHWWSEDSSVIFARALTVTLAGTPAFSSQFALARTVSAIHCDGNTFSGSATGTRYEADANGVIQTAAAGATYLPGSTSGATATGGQYI